MTTPSKSEYGSRIKKVRKRMEWRWVAVLLVLTVCHAQAITSSFQFTHAVYNVTIPENPGTKTFVVSDSGRMGIYKGDEDLKLTYKIVSGDKDKFFKAEERLVGDFWFLLIRTRIGNTDVLNRERKDKHVLHIKASAMKKDGRKASFAEAECKVIVNILDVNDLNPFFYPTDYEEEVPEDTPLHRSIIRVSADDADIGRNGEIYYSFKEKTEQFAIHPTSGVITLTRPLRHSEKAVHQLIALAKDRGAPYEGGGKAVSAHVKIKVRRVNLYSPEIKVNHLPNIVEHSNADIYAIVKVVDSDEGIHGLIRSLDIVDGDPDGHFRIRQRSEEDSDGTEFNIEVLKLLDRESAPQGYNLTLRAMDRGIPPRRTYKLVPVHLADLNDNAPVFDREIYEVDVPETSPINSPTIRLKVSDADMGRNAMVMLEIVGGNEGDEFWINPETGMLYTNTELDAEHKSFYTLTVTARDQGNTGTRKQSSAKVKINVVDANDNDPLFDTTEVEVDVNENSPAGTSVTKMVAKDRDSGENAYISYSIANLNPVPFEIDHFTGVIRTTQKIDYETMRRTYRLRIRASDWGLPYRRQTETQVKISIKEVNDNRPIFEKINCVGHVPRSIPIGSEIITLSAIDLDSGNIISYRIVSGNEDSCFLLDATSGVLSVTCDLADLRASERYVNVTATDGTHFADINTIRIKLTNAKRTSNPPGRILVDDSGTFECKDTGAADKLTQALTASEKNNHPANQDIEEFAMMPSRYGENIHVPEFINFPSNIMVNESKPLGSILASIRAKDRDLGYNGKLIFGIVSGDDDSVFRLEPETGELKVIGYLDRERRDEYLLNISVFDLGKPQKSISKLLPVTVVDVNDNAPKFRNPLSSFRIPEDAHNGTAIFHVTATDADQGNYSKIRYSLRTDTDDFRIDPNTGALYVSAPLDRERQEMYELNVRASDCGNNPNDVSALHTDALIRILVDDINDNAPSFALQAYSVKAREDLPLGTVVAIIYATDPDLGDGGQIRYALSGETENDDSFVIDESTGTIRISRQLDFETRRVHSLTIRATDKGSPPLSSEVNLIIEIVDVNENLHPPVFSDFVVAVSIPENEPPGTLVTKVKATDADPPGDDSRVSYQITSGEGLGFFSIDNEGNIRTLGILDAETTTHYWLTVIARDHGAVPLHSKLEVFVSVKDINDNVPLTEEPIYFPTVAENSPPDTSVIKLSASDADINSNHAIVYRISSGNPQSIFSINPHSGLITTTGRKLDREVQTEHILEVTVADDESPSLSSTTRVVVTVEDVNDNPPLFRQSIYRVSIPETYHQEAPLLQSGSGEVDPLVESQLLNGTWESFPENSTGDFLFRIVALDPDVGPNADINYEIMIRRGRGRFAIHPKTGVVYSQRSFQAGQDYDLLIKATDNGVPRKSSSTRVSLQVLPLPEEDFNHKPVIKTIDQHVQIHENDPVGFLVTLIQSEDEDKDNLWYRIIDGDPRDEFVIGNEGSILLAKPLNWEVQQSYNLTISVTDGIHTVFTHVFITVVDMNDHRPEFKKSIYSINVSESARPGSELLILEATDRDKDSLLQYGLYSAQNPSSLQLFKIDYLSGQLAVAQPLDRETTTEHVLTVMVKDQGTPAKKNFVRVKIHVHDANDHAPEFSLSILQGRVFETASVGTLVLTVAAVDRDHGINAEITYTISSGNVGNAFSLHPQLGTLHLSRELDMTSISEYMLIVKASDSGVPPLVNTIPVHIIVVMADNDPPRFARREVVAEVFENEPGGVPVIQLEARSTSSIVFDFVRGNTDNSFYINPTSGVIYSNTPLDYEKIKSYNLSVTATNMAGAKAVCHVVIHVLDRNDNQPVFLQTVYLGSINEGAPVGSLVLANHSLPLVINAYDSDSQLNSLLEYEIIEPTLRRMFHIDSTTGAIRTMVVLDYELSSHIEFHVRISDLGKPRLSSDKLARVFINVIDVNDSPPIFLHKEYNATILVPTYNNVVVIQLEADDKDSKEITKLEYSIVSGNVDKVYTISSETGVLTVRDTIKGSQTAPHRLKVQVSDGKYLSDTHVNIQWFKSQNSGLIFQKPLYQGSVLENDTKPMTVAVVSVIGNQLNEHLIFSIMNPSSYFTIGKTSGALRTTGLKFDREDCEYFQLIVQAQSGEISGKGIRVAHVPVNITVLDVNDNCPMFVNLPYYAVVSIDAHKGDVVTKVHAIDLDKGENGDVRYELIKGNGELFKISRKTGEIILKQALEGHNKEYLLIIAAYDGGATPCSTEVPVSIKVMDRSMPVFDKQFYTVSTSENVELYTPLAVDIKAESPLGRTLIYSIHHGNELEKFDIDYKSGRLYIVEKLDYETQQEYALTVRATDSISGVFAEVLVSVMVTDVNDCSPEFPMDTYNVSVSEAAQFGSSIIKLTAKDNDTGINGVIHYFLAEVSLNVSDYFHIDPDDGSVYLKQSLDHEVANLHHLYVIAEDSGVPKLSSSTHIWISVIDMNDNPPKLEQELFTCWLSEEASRDQFVTIVTASDPDLVNQNQLTYSIVGGNQQQIFSIDSSSGIITLTNIHKLLNNHAHVLNVSVSDGVYTTFARVRVEILSANKHNPVFEKHLYEAKIPENTSPGKKITVVSANDNDSGPYGSLTYSIISDYLNDNFGINNVTGEVYSKRSFDREHIEYYEIPIMAKDAGGRAGFTTVKVRVTDVNDNPPKFVLPEYKACIPSNFTVDSTFMKVKAVDEDSISDLEYTLYESAANGAKDIFTINKITGGISLKKSALDYENQVYQFFIRSSDGGNPPLQNDVSVSVYIMASSDNPPIFERREDKIFITESAAPGTVITHFNLVSSVAVTYKLMSGGDFFNIDPNGRVLLSRQLDREKKKVHIIAVLALTDSSPPLSALNEIVVHILDHNDNAPIFHSDNYDIQIAENLEIGCSILKVHAADSDDGKNGEVRYSLQGLGGESFAVDSHTGWLTNLVPLDREVTPYYLLNVIASDSGVPSLSSNISVKVTLVDYNDNPPVFTQDAYSAAVNEDALPGTVVILLSVTDKDSDPSNVEFYIISGDSLSQFSVRSTGEVFVARPLDRELIDKYELSVLATDGKFVAITIVEVKILDSNDQQPVCLHYRYSRIVSEMVSPGTSLLTVLAVDMDLDPKLKFYLTGDNSDHFIIDKTSGELKTAKTLDREEMKRYSFVAHVQDREHSEWECISYIDIIVSDVNDNIPTFSSLNYTTSVYENSPIGTVIFKMHATDIDSGINKRIKYFLSDSANSHFKIIPESGIIILAKNIDRETRDSYNLTVKAIDEGSPPLWSVAYVHVMVLDINDNAPEFVSRSYYLIIPESAIIDAEVGRVMATSQDSGINAQIEYSIIGGNEHGKFAINKKTGIISISQPLDYERAHDYLLTIQASDLGMPPLSSQATVNITVTDFNDNAPIFSQHSFSARINEDANIGDVIIQVLATDLDSGINGKLVYSIERGDKHQQFSIDSDSGYLSVSNPLDREMVSSYVLHIRASDCGVPELSSFTVINIELMDVNDNPPLFTQSNYTVIVQEDKRPGWAVCQLLVTDADIPPNTGPFTFDLQSTTGLRSFQVEPDGTLRTAALLNHRIQDTYLLHVRVFDNGTPPLYSDTWVIVKVIEESQYPPAVNPLDIWVGSYQERWMGGELGSVYATDQDQYDTLTYSFVNTQSYSQYFTIDPKKGIIYAAPALDTGRYILNVSVSDDKFTAYGPVHVYVEPIWDEMLHQGFSIRIPGTTPRNFVLTKRKNIIKSLKQELDKEVSLVSVQDGGKGDTEILITVKGGYDIDKLNAVLRELTLPTIQLDCRCKNEATCRQKISLDSRKLITISTDVFAFVAPAHIVRTFCSCTFGFTGELCEDKSTGQCECPPSQTCVPQPVPPGYVCAPPSPASPLCSLNHSCPSVTANNPSLTSSITNISLEHLTWVAAVSVIVLTLLCCCICLLCRKYYGSSTSNERNQKSVSLLNSDVTRATSKQVNLEITQCATRPVSYTLGSNTDVYSGPLNNLDTVRSYGSAGDELENFPPDYVKNLNRNTNSPSHKIHNDLKRLADKPKKAARRSFCAEDDARILGGYHWDCSDWVRPNQNPLPNITEVPGSEVPDSSSFHSNDSNSNDSNANQPIFPVIMDPARDLATLDEELYHTYRSEEEEVMRYGFPQNYCSQSDLSTNVCDIEDSDVPT